MSTLLKRRVAAATCLLGLLALSACATAPGASPAPTSTTAYSDQLLEQARPAPPDGRVIAVGTVLDQSGDVRLCPGPVAESAPPQCSGPPLDGWSWTDVDGGETSGDVTWGAYAVYATWDGDRLSRTADIPIILALYDPARPDDPTRGVDGTVSPGERQRVQDDIAARLGDRALSVWQERGYVWVQVLWDDGTIQEAADAEYGQDVVVVTSALREVD
jgi:hypothetical protein